MVASPLDFATAPAMAGAMRHLVLSSPAIYADMVVGFPQYRIHGIHTNPQFVFSIATAKEKPRSIDL
jgi:hypothetical protein